MGYVTVNNNDKPLSLFSPGDDRYLPRLVVGGAGSALSNSIFQISRCLKLLLLLLSIVVTTKLIRVFSVHLLCL